MRVLNRLLPHRRHTGKFRWLTFFLGALLMAALAGFWLFLSDYQQSLPQNYADQILRAYQSGDVKQIREYSINLPRALENPVAFLAYYKENADLGNLYYYPGASDGPEQL